MNNNNMDLLVKDPDTPFTNASGPGGATRQDSNNDIFAQLDKISSFTGEE